MAHVVLPVPLLPTSTIEQGGFSSSSMISCSDGDTRNGKSTATSPMSCATQLMQSFHLVWLSAGSSISVGMDMGNSYAHVHAVTLALTLDTACNVSSCKLHRLQACTRALASQIAKVHEDTAH